MLSSVYIHDVVNFVMFRKFYLFSLIAFKSRKYKHFTWSAVFVWNVPWILDIVQTLLQFHVCVSCVILKIKKKKDTARTREHEESNTFSQNKENIHTLNNNIAFEN